MEPVPVAEKLLQTKLFGFSIKRLIQAFAVPMAPGLILTVLNFPAIIFGPVVFAGVLVGIAVYVRTPPGQNPASWLIGMISFKIGPSRYRWKPVKFQDGDNMVEYGEGNSAALKNPEDNQESTGMIGNDNTVENLDFQAIHDSGVFETEESFGLLIEIEPRPWLILDGQSREAVYHSFSQFLMTVKSPIQIFTLPVPFDPGEYTKSIAETNKYKPSDESKLLEHGRVQHSNWLENVVEMGEIRDRRHFIIVTAKKHSQNEEEGGTGLLSKLKPTRKTVDQQKRYDSLWSRAESVNSILPRTGTKTNIVDNRDDVLKILYYYYKGDSSPKTMNHGWLTRPDPQNEGSSENRANI